MELLFIKKQLQGICFWEGLFRVSFQLTSMNPVDCLKKTLKVVVLFSITWIKSHPAVL